MNNALKLLFIVKILRVFNNGQHYGLSQARENRYIMGITLNSVEIRILGCLIEKQLTTPDYYPLTLNSLLAACNQKSNREPVMQLSESEVLTGLNSLIEKTLVREKMLPGSRTAKYEHKLSDTLTREYDFNQQQLAILIISQIFHICQCYVKLE